jgi:hypothetical protein
MRLPDPVAEIPHEPAALANFWPHANAARLLLEADQLGRVRLFPICGNLLDFQEVPSRRRCTLAKAGCAVIFENLVGGEIRIPVESSGGVVIGPWTAQLWMTTPSGR